MDSWRIQVNQQQQLVQAIPNRVGCPRIKEPTRI
jgi:hypothetical protein